MGTVTCVRGQQGVWMETVALLHGDSRQLHGDGWHLRGGGRGMHGTVAACTGTAATGTGTAWDTAGMCMVAMPGAAAVGAGQEECPHPDGERCCSPGRCWVTLVAPGEGLGPTCLLRELAHPLLNGGWDGAGPTRVRESLRSFFTSRLGFHLSPRLPSSSSPFPPTPPLRSPRWVLRAG